MKSLVVILFIIMSLYSRENPFDSPFQRPDIEQDFIPLLSINNYDRFSTTKEINNTKKKIISEKKPLKYKAPESTKKVFLVPPIIIDDTNSTLKKTSTIIDKKPHNTKKSSPKKKNKYFKKYKPKYRLIFKNYFLKSTTNNRYIKLYTKDCLICKKIYKNPRRVVFDFKRLQYFDTKIIDLNSKSIKTIKFGSHHKFYRITITLKNKTELKIKKTNYGYLIY